MPKNIQRECKISPEGVLERYSETNGSKRLEIELNGSSYKVTFSENGKRYAATLTGDEVKTYSLIDRERSLFFANRLNEEASKLRKKAEAPSGLNLKDFVGMIKAKESISFSPSEGQ